MPPRRANTLALVAEPRRAEILRLLWDGERSAGDIAGRLPVTFGAVSQHLSVLLRAGLVRVRAEGRRRIYTADRDALAPLAPYLERLWGDKLAQLKRLAEAEQRRLDAGRSKPPARRRSHGAASTPPKRARP